MTKLPATCDWGGRMGAQWVPGPHRQSSRWGRSGLGDTRLLVMLFGHPKMMGLRFQGFTSRETKKASSTAVQFLFC